MSQIPVCCNTSSLRLTTVPLPLLATTTSQHISTKRSTIYEEDVTCADYVRYLRINRCTVGDLEVESMIRDDVVTSVGRASAEFKESKLVLLKFHHSTIYY